MQGFLDDLEHTARPLGPDALADFRAALEEANSHPSRSYFVLKSIVLGNLYGVDIMEEAVEICKLRLFLKLVAQLETYDQIEPLPDIDFNIRAGNTIVGFTSLDALREAITVTPDGRYRALSDEDRAALKRIEVEALSAAEAFTAFRAMQTGEHDRVAAAKQDLRRRLDSLRDELNRYLATEYGIEADDQAGYDRWLVSHRPFHWLAEFHEIMTGGGFDAVIGNPPYVSRRKAEQSYKAPGFATSGCPDIYAPVVERSVGLCRPGGRAAMIVPLNLTFGRQFGGLRELLHREFGGAWFSSYGRIPSALFSADTRVRNTIFVGRKEPGAEVRCFTTRLHRWFSEERPALFDSLTYAPYSPQVFGGLIPKLGSAPLLRGLEKLLGNSDYRFERELSQRGGHPLHFSQTAYNWLTFCVDQPPAFGPEGGPAPQTKYGTVRFGDQETRDLSMLLANGNLMFLWWVAVGDDFDLTQANFKSAPFGPGTLDEDQRRRLLQEAPRLAETMADNVEFKLNAGRQVGNYNLARCRHVTDLTDAVWLEALDLDDLRDEIALECSLVVKTDFGP